MTPENALAMDGDHLNPSKPSSIFTSLKFSLFYTMRKKNFLKTVLGFKMSSSHLFTQGEEYLIHPDNFYPNGVQFLFTIQLINNKYKIVNAKFLKINP